MTDTKQQFCRECAELPPEDIAFLGGLAQMIGAMYCRLHPVPAQSETEPRKEETNNDNS